MTDNRDAQGPAANSKTRPGPFRDAPGEDVRPALDVQQYAPRKIEDEIVPAKGADLSDKPKIIFVVGRGKTGKTTFLRWMAERALDAERPFLMADIDPTNASFSSYFSEVARPLIYDPAAVRAWLQRFIIYAVKEKITAVVDLGGGDTALRSLLTEMPAIFSEIEAAGLVPVAFYMCGPQPDDLAPIVTLSSHGFAPAARAIVFNEGVADTGQPRQTTFAEAAGHPIVKDQSEKGALILWMPKLFAASAVESRRAGFGDVRDGKTQVPVNLFDRTRVRAWLEAMDNRFSGVGSWLP